MKNKSGINPMSTKRPLRFFNTTGPCHPDDHYMLPPEDRLVGADTFHPHNEKRGKANQEVRPDMFISPYEYGPCIEV